MAGFGKEESSVCWRKEVDWKVSRVQSMLFGADEAIEKGDFSSAQVICLALIGFLDSHHSDDNNHFILPIRRQALSILDLAKPHLFPLSDSQAFELAGRQPGPSIFTKLGDIHSIKQSCFCPPLFQRHGSSPTKQDYLHKTSKNLIQPNLTSFFGKNAPRHNNNNLHFTKNSHDDDYSVVLDKKYPTSNSPNTRTVTRPQEPERVRGGPTSATKWSYRQTLSPINEIHKSPPCAEEDVDASTNGFVTAKAKLEIDARRKRGLTGSPSAPFSQQDDVVGTNKAYGSRSYGISRRGVRGNFVPPIKSTGNTTANVIPRNVGKGDDAMDDSTRKCLEFLCGPDGELPEKLRNLEPRLIEHVSNEIMDRDPNVRWNDIAGLEHAKKCVTEMVIWPLLRPDIFKGCRSPGRGLLLFGPPGTGKTMIGKAIAGEAKATFFYISASSLTSKWIGEGEKLVRALFGVASCRQPAVIFVDEIDSLLSQRKSEGEHESSRRLKTQFLIEMEGFDGGNEQILLIGATNRPQELDEAARRRLTKRLYIPLPTAEARAWIIKNLLEKDGLFNLSKEEIDTICKMTEGYSGSDMKNLVKDASMGPLRVALEQGIEITKLKKEDLGPVHVQDFEKSLQEVRPSVSLNELGVYERWNEQFGSLSL